MAQSPPRSAAGTTAAARAEALQPQLLPQNLLHDLVRPAADGAEPRVAAGARDSVLLHVAGAAEDLQGVVRLVERVALGLQLRHRHFLDGVDARVVEPQRIVGE